MPALSIPADLKKINPYIRRAEELDKDTNNAESRLVAYYCRQFAVHVGIPLAASSSKAKECLGRILEDLEKEKAAMDNFSKEEAKFLCAQFANRIFNKANEEDMNGTATKGTAKTFYAAATFLQMLDQFNPSDEEQEEMDEDTQIQLHEEKNKILYAKWKSTEILKAMKEGRKPTPGGYEMHQQQQQNPTEGGNEDGNQHQENSEPEIEIPLQTPAVTTVNDDSDEDNVNIHLPPSSIPPAAPSTMAPLMPPPRRQQQEDEGTEVEYALGPPPVYSAAQSKSSLFQPKVPPPVVDNIDLPSAPLAPPVALSPKKAKKRGGIFGFGKGEKKNGKVTKAQLADAVELTKFALSALESRDGELGAARLEQALEILRS